MLTKLIKVYRMIKVILALTLMMMSSQIFASDFIVKDYKRYIELIGVVDGSALELAERINNLAVKNTEEIAILINSPGGSVMHGMILVDSIRQAQAKGVKFRCLVPVLAASMAYIIFNECNERYTFNSSLLLWHEMSVSLRGAKIRNLYVTLWPLIQLQQRVELTLRKGMKVSKSFYQKHSDAETMWTGHELHNELNGYVTLVKNVDVKTENLYRFMKPSFDLFGQGTGFEDVDKILKRVINN